MSRVIIKNLPKGIKEERLRKTFGVKGTITDCAMKYTRDGAFRKFAFIGYKTVEEAESAVKHFNKSFIDTSKIQVEIAKDFSDANKPRPWSKYSQGSSAHEEMLKKQTKPHKDDTDSKTKKGKKEKEKKEQSSKAVDSLLGDLKSDPEFQEFLEVHKSRSTKPAWVDDTGPDTKLKEKHKEIPSSGSEEDTGDVEDNHSEEAVEKDGEEKDHGKKSSTAHRNLSDLEYLKSKVTKKVIIANPSDELSESENVVEDVPSESHLHPSDEDNVSVEVKEKTGSVQIKYEVKMRGLPLSHREKQIKEFFQSLKVKAIRIPTSAMKKPMGIAYVEFTSEKDLDQALRRNKLKVGDKRVYLKKVAIDVQEATEKELKPWETKMEIPDDSQSSAEVITETGRLFVRNLAYICKEENLEELFSKYGPLTEVNLPVDNTTKKVKGFAFITFMMPEHAVKAYTELDGTVFQGRMLHILPGKSPKDEELGYTESSSYKKKKAAENKATSGSSHSWNSLFLGSSAVADVMAEKYDTTKGQILDAETSQSLGVRMALGETQIVTETRNFLLEHGVCLDAFSQPASARSKTVILAKNLPAGTKSEEISNIFCKYGKLSQVVLPPSGITAIVEFQEPSEARRGFKNLAYTKFQHLPLFLEWAPIGVFINCSNKIDEDETPSAAEQQKTVDDASDDEQGPEPGCILFVKNLSFNCTEGTLKNVFSKCGHLHSVTIARKKDVKHPGKLLSMGYGFVEYKKKASAQKALKQLQHEEVEGHCLELKVSERTTTASVKFARKQASKAKQKSSKMLVRNIPFEANVNEIKELFRVFGELKSVRLPKKMQGTGSHRGFGFVDFVTQQDAKRAFESLVHSTHLYGRRLVLEWADAAEETVDSLRRKTADHFGDSDISAKRMKKSNLLDTLKKSETVE